MCISCLAAVALSFLAPAASPQIDQTFQEPIDAVSISFAESGSEAEVRSFDGDSWSEWEEVTVDDEQDPYSRESDLLVFARDAVRVQVKSDSGDVALQPIRVSDEPSSYEVAATSLTSKPRILSRKEWGADESLRYRNGGPVPSAPSTNAGDNGATGSVPQRVQECNDAMLNYPREFRTVRKTAQENGKQLRWAHEYSPQVKVLAVHHTAIKVNGDARSAVERVRALYQYHTVNRGWGDIGYHYLIDEDGQVYEGKAGGKGVVGGHAYCNNVGTVGIALMGNFTEEQPSQEQMKSLQWLIDHMGDVYDIETDATVRHHGITMPAVVGHGDLVSTDCPGYYVRETLDQVRSNVSRGALYASIDFPPPPRGSSTPIVSNKPYIDRAAQRRALRLAQLPAAGSPGIPAGISPIGSSVIEGRPGDQAVFSVRYRAGNGGVTSGSRIATVRVSDTSIGLWQTMGQDDRDARRQLTAPSTLGGGDTALLRLKVQFPTEAGRYTVKLGDSTVTLAVSGRRILRRRSAALPLTGERTARSSAAFNTLRRARSSASRASRVPSTVSPSIRIRLSYTLPQAVLRDTAGAITTLRLEGDGCTAVRDGRVIQRGIVRLGGGTTMHDITSWDKATNRFRGVMECRNIGGELVLINELPLEEYMAGLAEEPDSEPYEKQRAFAIAARTYAAWYLRDATRKFPGMPYDGSDSPASFQMYGGVAFEERNPSWLRAVQDTAGEVLTLNGQLIKPPYFSQSDGRTLHPSEAGWGNFPFAEVFASKPDPWCAGMERRGHGVGMSGCGAEAQAQEGQTAEQILAYYYAGTTITPLARAR